MAKLTRDDVLRLAQLARLKLTDAEVGKLQDELGSILGYVEQLDQVDVAGIEPTYQVTGLTNVTRGDEEIDYGIKRGAMIKLLPAAQDDYIKVKRMVA